MILVRLQEAFPSIESVEEWREVGEYQRLEDFVRSKGIDQKRGDTMLRQMRTKQISHGPSFRLRMSASDGDPMINVSHFRWGITFSRTTPFSKTDASAINTFLISIGIGNIESYSED